MAMKIASASIKLNNIRSYIAANVDLQLTQCSAPRLYIQGPPGAGKSMIMEEICRENGWGLKCQYISNCALEYLTGLPCKVEHGKTVEWSKPAILNTDNLDYCPPNYEKGKTPVIILFDDFHLCDRVMQKYMFQLLTYKGLNDYRLDDNIAIVLAGNRITDKAGAMPIPAPVCNRMLFVEVEVDTQDWLVNFAFKNNVRDDVISFIHNKGDVYLSMNPIESASWASPRAWTYLASQMDSYEKRFGKISLDVLRVMAVGEVGPEAASEFITYRELFAKWDFDKLSKRNIKELTEEFAEESKKNPTSIYAIISAAVSWMVRVYRENDYDINNETVKRTVAFTYDVLASFLIMRIKGVNPVPMVLAGVQFINLYSSSDGKQDDTKTRRLSKLFLNNLSRDRDIDYLFLEIICNIFHAKLEEEDIERIKQAKKNLNYDGKVIED